MDTVTLAFLMQEAAKELISLFGDRFALKLPKARDTLDHLIAAHRALSELSRVIEELALVLGTAPPDPEAWRRLSEYSRRSLPLLAPADTVGALLDRAQSELASLSASLDRLGPQLAIFGPEVNANLRDAYDSDAAFVDRIEAGITVENLPELKRVVSAARDAVAKFTRENYSIKDVKN